MPIYNWNMQPFVAVEDWREYYSTLNFRKIVNGTSGFTPPPWQNMVINLMTQFPSDSSVQQLKNLGVNLIIVHKAEYDKLYNSKFVVKNKRVPNGTDIINFLNSNSKALLIKTIGGKLIIIGCGGVFNAKDAYEKIKLGASLVQLITGLVFEGPFLAAQINSDLVNLLKKDGYNNISEAIGAEAKN